MVAVRRKSRGGAEFVVHEKVMLPKNLKLITTVLQM